MNADIRIGDVRERLAEMPDGSVQCCITSPPYWGLRDYGTAQWEGGDAECDHVNKHSLQGATGERANRTFTGSQNFYREQCAKCGARRIDRQIGLEPTPEAYVATMVEVFREVRRILRDDGVLFLNLGDSYWGGKGQNGTSKSLGNAKERGYQQPRGTIVSEMRPQDGKHDTLKPKDLIGIPWRVAFALQADGWYLRSALPWVKRNPMPESVTDRPGNGVEYVFLLSKSQRYYYDHVAVMKAANMESQRGAPVNATMAEGNMTPDSNRRINYEKGRHKVARRNFRNTDLFYSSLDAPPFGLVSDADGEPLALDVNPAAYKGWNEQVVWQRVPAPDDGADGMRCKVSQDCPIHGRRGQPCDGPEDALLNHNEDTCRRPFQLQQPEQSSSSIPPGTPTTANSRGSLDQLCVRSATGRSNQTRKMDHAPSTILPCTPCEETTGHIGDRQDEQESAGTHHGKRENKTLLDDCTDSPSNQNPHHTAGIEPQQDSSEALQTSCTCEWYARKVKKTSHSATFPPKLVEPLLLAGTSEKGCCAKCGKAWERVVEKSREYGSYHNHENDLARGQRHEPGKKLVGDDFYEKYQPPKTTGWRPGCACNAAVAPCVVLDPFGGSGTVGAVALRHGRRAILIELNEAYKPLIEERIASAAADAGLFGGTT